MRREDIHKPEDIQWVEGPLPPPESVPYGTAAMFWAVTWDGDCSHDFSRGSSHIVLRDTASN
jgi:hypothetical protein